MTDENKNQGSGCVQCRGGFSEQLQQEMKPTGIRGRGWGQGDRVSQAPEWVLGGLSAVLRSGERFLGRRWSWDPCAL